MASFFNKLKSKLKISKVDPSDVKNKTSSKVPLYKKISETFKQFRKNSDSDKEKAVLPGLKNVKEIIAARFCSSDNKLKDISADKLPTIYQSTAVNKNLKSILVGSASPKVYSRKHVTICSS